MFINTSSIIPSILARYISNSNISDNTAKSNVSTNNDTKIISNNCLCYNGRFIYIFRELFSNKHLSFVSFDDFVLYLLEFCFSEDNYEQCFYDMLDEFFKLHKIGIDGTCYHLLII